MLSIIIEITWLNLLQYKAVFHSKFIFKENTFLSYNWFFNLWAKVSNSTLPLENENLYSIYLKY